VRHARTPLRSSCIGEGPAGPAWCRCLRRGPGSQVQTALETPTSSEAIAIRKHQRPSVSRSKALMERIFAVRGYGEVEQKFARWPANGTRSLMLPLGGQSLADDPSPC